MFIYIYTLLLLDSFFKIEIILNSKVFYRFTHEELHGLLEWRKVRKVPSIFHYLGKDILVTNQNLTEIYETKQENV